MDHHKFIQAALKLKQAAATRRHAMEATEQDAVDALECGDRPRAAAVIEALLARQPDAMRWWHELASIRMHDGDSVAAATAWQQALRCDLEDLPLLHRIGRSLDAAGHDPGSFAEHAWASLPEAPVTSALARSSSRSPEFLAACLDVLRNDCAKALQVFIEIQQSRPASKQPARNLAFLLECLGRHGQAQCVLATNRLARGNVREAAEAFEAAPEADAQAPVFLDKYLQALRLAGKEQRAIQIAAGMAPESCTTGAYMEWAKALMDLHCHEEAVKTLRHGAATHNDEFLALQADLILPPVPVSQMVMEQAHQRVCRAIHALSERPLPEDPDKLASLEEALCPNFFLAYLGAPCVDEARAYGRFVRRVIQARHPRCDEPRPARRRSPGDRIRIGYATSHATQHVVMMYFVGWLQHADRELFEIHLFPLATERNWVAGYLTSLVDTCHAPATDAETAARQIRESELDLLVYPEIGTDALSFRLASMRLAPVQCVAGGHPVTTGLASLDYFLSVAAAEPTNAAEHYTERLVTLPGTGVCMPLPALPAERKSRADFGLAPDEAVYLSTQSLFKYPPCHDEVFARIAQSVDNAVFVFSEGHYPAWTRTFTERLRSSFEAHGLSPDRHLRFVPTQDYESFLCLNAISDVFLDPLGGFSAGMTALDAVVCGLPIVTLPGALMRTRMGCGMLTRLGIEDAIATDVDDYVRLAVHLGKDADLRAEMSRRIQDRRHLLFDDVHGVKALEAFFRWATGSARPGDEALFELGPEPI